MTSAVRDGARPATHRLIDEFMPNYDVVERHRIRVAARPVDTYAALRSVDLGRSRVIHSLFAIRGLFARPGLRGLFGLPRRPGPLHPVSPPSMNLDGFIRAGFVPLGERPGVEIVLGLVGQFWKVTGGERPKVGPAEFLAFDRPGFAKATWNVRVDSSRDGSTIVSTETRVLVTDDRSRRTFLRYWWLIGPFSGLIRRRMLALVRKAAEGGLEPSVAGTPAPPVE